MENYSGLLPFLWKTFKTKPQERRRAPEMQPLSMSMPHLMSVEDDEEMIAQQDDEYFLVGKSPKSPGMFGRMSGSSPGRASSPARTHRRRHSTGLSGFSLPKMLSSNSQRHR